MARRVTVVLCPQQSSAPPIPQAVLQEMLRGLDPTLRVVVCYFALRRRTTILALEWRGEKGPVESQPPKKKPAVPDREEARCPDGKRRPHPWIPHEDMSPLAVAYSMYATAWPGFASCCRASVATTDSAKASAKTERQETKVVRMGFLVVPRSLSLALSFHAQLLPASIYGHSSRKKKPFLVNTLSLSLFFIYIYAYVFVFAPVVNMY